MSENTFFDDSGFYIGPDIPNEAVNDCTQPGIDASDDVNYWVERLGFAVPRELAIRWLREFGAWDDLDTWEDDKLAQKVFWVACGDLKEHGEFIGLVH